MGKFVSSCVGLITVGYNGPYAIGREATAGPGPQRRLPFTIDRSEPEGRPVAPTRGPQDSELVRCNATAFANAFYLSS